MNLPRVLSFFRRRPEPDPASQCADDRVVAAMLRPRQRPDERRRDAALQGMLAAYRGKGSASGAPPQSLLRVYEHDGAILVDIEQIHRDRAVAAVERARRAAEAARGCRGT